MEARIVLLMRKAFPVFLAFLAAPHVFADTNAASSWFRNEPRAAAYAAVEPDVLRVFDDAEKAGLPVPPLMDKLKEGASKRVTGSLLVSALRAESDRLSAGQSLLEKQGVRFSDPTDREDALRAISLMVVAGISSQTIGSFFALAPRATRDPLDVVEVLNVLAQVKLSSKLAEEMIQGLGAALLKSRMPRAAFKSIPPFLLKASALGMGDDAIDRIIIDTLESGGTLIQMEAELQKQTHWQTGSQDKAAAPPTSPQIRPSAPNGASAASATPTAPAAGGPNRGQPGHRKLP